MEGNYAEQIRKEIKEVGGYSYSQYLRMLVYPDPHVEAVYGYRIVPEKNSEMVIDGIYWKQHNPPEVEEGEFKSWPPPQRSPGDMSWLT